MHAFMLGIPRWQRYDAVVEMFTVLSGGSYILDEFIAVKTKANTNIQKQQQQPQSATGYEPDGVLLFFYDFLLFRFFFLLPSHSPSLVRSPYIFLFLIWPSLPLTVCIFKSKTNLTEGKLVQMGP